MDESSSMLAIWRGIPFCRSQTDDFYLPGGNPL